MVSGIGPEATLQSLNIPVLANLPGVGQNFQVRMPISFSPFQF
jgi:choline dehydrogenase-like flavoprotein